MKTSDFYYDLPEELIAQDPLLKRSDSRLMILDKETGAIRHDIFHNITGYLNPGDTLVINDTKVIPARLLGQRAETGSPVEILLLKRLDDKRWETIVRPGKKLRIGSRAVFGNTTDDPEEKPEGESGKCAGVYPLEAEVVEVLPDGNRIVEFTYDGIFEEILDSLGEMPLPPYITHKLQDKDRYQTVYAKYEGSAAAPTAGLHFTKELLSEIQEKGVNIASVTLHVGLGTFRPVKVDDVTKHHMHTEIYNVTREAADIINNTKKTGGRVICVGTTSCRTVESCADKNGMVVPGHGETGIFIYPGYEFKVLDALITNFHLPESTLLMLVSALAGRENILAAYEEAVKERYRFFSFGDAMFITHHNFDVL